MRAETRHESFVEDKAPHPITTPKGANLLTVVLTVVGAFIPFFTGLEAAQIVAGLAALIIVWLYWAEARDVVERRAKLSGLALPIAAIIIILSVALIATIKVGSRTRPPAALTMSDVSDAVERAISKTKIDAPTSVAQPIPVDRSITYRSIIEEPLRIERPRDLEPIVESKPKTTTTEDLEPLIRRFNRQAVEGRVTNQCNSKRWKIDNGLVGLIAQAALAQNQYHAYRVSKQIVGDYKIWLPKVREFLDTNKDQLPDVAIFELASRNIDDPFSGGGTKVWGNMDNQRQALESLRRQLDAIPCEKIGKAAVTECEEAGNCQSVAK